jgi:hypothetical protein
VGPDLSLPVRLVFVPHVNPHVSARGNQMSRNASYVKFALLMLLIVALAMFLGGDPWGPI